MAPGNLTLLDDFIAIVNDLLGWIKDLFCKGQLPEWGGKEVAGESDASPTYADHDYVHTLRWIVLQSPLCDRHMSRDPSDWGVIHNYVTGICPGNRVVGGSYTTRQRTDYAQTFSCRYTRQPMPSFALGCVTPNTSMSLYAITYSSTAGALGSRL